MVSLDPSMAEQIAEAAIAFQRERTGHEPRMVAVVQSGDTLLITLCGPLSPGEKALAQSPNGTAQLQESHRQLFANSANDLRQEIQRITGVEVREAVAEVETTTGTVVQVFSMGDVVQVFLVAEDELTGDWTDSGVLGRNRQPVCVDSD